MSEHRTSNQQGFPKVYEPFPAGERPKDWPIEYVALGDHNRIVDRLTAELADWKERWAKGGGLYSGAVAERERLRAALEWIVPYLQPFLRRKARAALAGAADETTGEQK